MLTRRHPLRSAVARLCVLSMVATLLGMAPAGAAIDTSLSCPGTIESAGFEDIDSFDPVTQRAIDCLATHGITHGTSATTFDPTGSVPRWQMALFLVRQASVHGVTLPDGADQGFTDISAYDADTRLAINQLAQLGVTIGTGPTTFDPDGQVSRWQMALFIVRLLSAAGSSLPGAVDQGFTDLAGHDADTVAAIDRLAALGIAEGTSATTFSPDDLTERWHMALFLSRTLAVAGILPPGVGPIDVTPAGAAYLDWSSGTVSRQYMASVAADAVVAIELWPASTIRTNGTFEAATAGTVANCDITLVEGSATAADKVTDVVAVGGAVNFTVGCSGLQGSIVPVVYVGTSVTGLAGASVSAPKLPTNEALGLGGSVAAVAEAPAGAFGPVTVGAVDKDADFFVSGGLTYFYDAGDTFEIGGTAATMAAWEAALSTGDDVVVGSTYAAGPAGTSIFDLSDVAPLAPAWSLAGVTGTTATFTYVADAGVSQVRVLSCLGTGCALTPARTVAAGIDEDPVTAGTQIVISGLMPSTDHDFAAIQIQDGDKSDPSATVDVDTPVELAITAVAVQDVNDGSGTWTGLVVTFDKDVQFDAGVGVSDVQIYTVDNPGAKINATVLANGPGSNQVSLVFPSQSDTTPDTDWVVQIAAGALDVGAGAEPNGTVTATFSH